MRDTIIFRCLSGIITLMFMSMLACTTAQQDDQQNKSSQAMSSLTERNEDEHIYWINSLKVPCQGVGAMQCLQVQKGKEMQPDQWQLFYASINGFDYEAGYIYQLVVKEEKLPPAQVPADASSIKYSLVKIISKEADPKIRLHDIWVLEKMEGEALDTDKLKEHPRMEINLTEQRIMGFDGCNNFNGSIKAVDGTTLQFGPIAGTRKMCMDMRIPDHFNQLLGQVHSYQINNLTLYLYDNQQNELLAFQKTD